MSRVSTPPLGTLDPGSEFTSIALYTSHAEGLAVIPTTTDVTRFTKILLYNTSLRSFVYRSLV